MKALSLCLLCLTLLVRPAGAQPTAELRGHLANVKSEKLLISWWSQPFASHEQQQAIQVEPNGDFHLSMPLKRPTLTQLSYGDEEIPVFLEPGDALVLRGDASKLTATSKFESSDGDAQQPAAAANNYLQEFSRRFTNNEGFQVLPDNILLYEKGFLDFLTYRRDHEQALLKQASRHLSFTPAFQAYAEADIAYTYAEDRLTYADLREQTVAGQPGPELSATYYDFLKEPNLLPGNEMAVTSSHYQDFLLDYIHYQVRVTGHQPTDPAYFPACYRLADSLLHGKARPVVLGRIILETARQGHVAHAHAMFTSYTATAQAPAAWVAVLRSDLLDHQAYAIGSPAPTIPLRLANGKRLSLEAYQGKVVYLMFWDSRFPASQRELSHLKELTAAVAGKPIVVLLVALDDSPTNWQHTQATASPALTGVQAYVPASRIEAVRQAYSIERLPAAVLIAEDGTLLDLHPHTISSRPLQDELKAAVGRAAAYRAVSLARL